MDDPQQVAALPSTSTGSGRVQRRWPLVLVGLFLAFSLLATLGRRIVVMNPTDSVEPGLYLAVPGGDVEAGRLVSFRIPEAARPYFAARADRPVEDAGG